MQNLDQIRARNALAFSRLGGISGKQGGEVIKKIPPVILNHGLLAGIAYSYTENVGWQLTFDALALHLADEDIAILPKDTKTRQAMMEFLTGSAATSETLKLATAEAMAWLAFARRFVKKPDPTPAS